MVQQVVHLTREKEVMHNMLWISVEKYLKEKKMTQAELARRAKVTESVISSLKHGAIKKPSFELVCKLADGLEVKTDDLRSD